MAGAYLVSIGGQVEGRTLRNGVDSVVVYANDATNAKAIAEASFGYVAPAVWAAATATLVAGGADLTGWNFRVRVIKVSDGTTTVDVTYTGVTSDTFDLVGAALVTALNATAPIAGAAYNSSTQVLKVAETTDNLGDHQLVYTFSPPGANQNVHIPGFVTAHVDLGASGDALTLTLAADGYTIPAVIAKVARS